MHPKLLTVFLFASVLFGCNHQVPVLYPKNTKPVVSSCSDESSCQPDNVFRAVTFNAGLAPGIQPLVDQRHSEVASRVAKEMEQSDLVCLQEVWSDEARQAIINAVQLPQENVFWFDSRGLGEDPKDHCSARQVRGLMRCMNKKCSDELPEDTSCIRKECSWHLTWLWMTGRHCLNCMTAMIGYSVDEAYQTCVEGTGASRAYGGLNGMLLLSRRPLWQTEAVMLPASGSNRVALMARVTTASGEEIEVACTHISSEISEAKPLNSGFENWEEEQAAQLKSISNNLSRRAQGKRAQMLMGDMNFSREHGYVKSEMIPSWNLTVTQGFDSPAARAEPPLCSLCSDNLISRTGNPRMVDHVMLRQDDFGNRLDPICAERVLDQPITVLDQYGQPVTTSLSDHFGIAVNFCLDP